MICLRVLVVVFFTIVLGERAVAADVMASDSPQPDTRESPGSESDKLAVFTLHRGFFVGSSIGIFESLGGLRGISNPEPHVAIRLGFDINDILTLQAVVQANYVANNPISKNDKAGAGGKEVESYGLMNLGVEGVVALRLMERVALEPRVGVGGAFFDPQPTDPNVSTPSTTTTMSRTHPFVSVGADLKYLTLLTGFDAGLSLTFYYIVGANVLGLAESLSLRYTF